MYLSLKIFMNVSTEATIPEKYLYLIFNFVLTIFFGKHNKSIWSAYLKFEALRDKIQLFSYESQSAENNCFIERATAIISIMNLISKMINVTTITFVT